MKMKRGAIKENGMVFWSYHKGLPNNEWWVTPEKFLEMKKKTTENARKYRNLDIQKHRDRCRKYREENREACLLSQREWRKNNKEKVKQYESSWREKNKDKYKASQKKWKEKNKSKVISDRLKRKYGICQNQYNNILESQSGVCAICFKTCETNQRLSVDHCHNTGKIRGLLCNKCNTALGQMMDSVENLRNAAEYLEKHQTISSI